MWQDAAYDAELGVGAVNVGGSRIAAFAAFAAVEDLTDRRDATAEARAVVAAEQRWLAVETAPA